MWNPFKKSSNNSTSGVPSPGILQALAMKKMAKMSPQEQQKMMQEAMKPENRGKLLSAMEQMKKMGMVTEEQIAQAKKNMGM